MALRRIWSFLTYPFNLRRRMKHLAERVDRLEYQAFNRRFYAVQQVAEYLISAQIPGDYAEFGVYRGTTFEQAYKSMASFFADMKFAAFDSFEGLPKPEGIDAVAGYTGNFHEKEFSCSEEEFLANMEAAGVDLSRIRTVKGWFDETLIPADTDAYGLEKIAAAWIDCDLYKSTVPVLDFLTSRLSTGSVIVFDDWRNFRNQPDFGEQKAVSEWLAKNPGITLRELFAYGWYGMVFTVHLP
jgi:O-methyltransferase